VGAPGKAYTIPCGEPFELKEESPGQQLGFPSVAVAEGDNAAALTGQGPSETIKEYMVSPENNLRGPKKEEKVNIPQNSENKNREF